MLLELIARLNPRSQNFLSASSLGGGSGNNSGSLTNEDIAGALAGCTHPLGSALLRTMIAGQDASEMYQAWQEHVRAEADRLGWSVNKRLKKEGTIDRLAAATLDEYMDSRCKTCLGRGIRRKRTPGDTSGVREDGYLVIDCDACKGTGRGAKTSSMRGRLLDMAPNSFDETWRVRYEMLLGELATIQRDAEDQYKRKLKRR